MINHVLLVGKIHELKVIDKKYRLYIEVKRNYKNVEGIYENDIFECRVWTAIGLKLFNNYNDGDLVSLKGRLEENEGKCFVCVEQIILLNKNR
jgi:single-stranded DNA-binding protein